MADPNYWELGEGTCNVNLINALSESPGSIQNYQYLHSCMYKVFLSLDLCQHVKETFVKKKKKKKGAYNHDEK